MPTAFISLKRVVIVFIDNINTIYDEAYELIDLIINFVFIIA